MSDWRQAEWQLRLPAWVAEVATATHYPTDHDRMRLAIALARRNVEAGDGGPFGAAVFDEADGRLIAPGVNLVLSRMASIAHAEIVALTIAQQVTGDFDLGADSSRRRTLVTSVEPCAMCLGALTWTGIARVVCGAREEDARAVGFDEGAKPADWTRTLEERGMTVTRDLLREEAAAVLRDYAAGGGPIYNPRR